MTVHTPVISTFHLQSATNCSTKTGKCSEQHQLLSHYGRGAIVAKPKISAYGYYLCIYNLDKPLNPIFTRNKTYFSLWCVQSITLLRFSADTSVSHALCTVWWIPLPCLSNQSQKTAYTTFMAFYWCQRKEIAQEIILHPLRSSRLLISRYSRILEWKVFLRAETSKGSQMENRRKHE